MKKDLTSLIILLMALSGTACSGKLEGSVFLDLNNNELKETAENKLTGVSFSVTKDEQDFKSGVTDANGNFSIELDGEGDYCVEVTQDGLKVSDSVSEVTALVKSLALAPTPVPVTVPVPVKFTVSDPYGSSDDNSSATIESGTVCQASDGFSWENDVPVSRIYSVDDISAVTSSATAPGSLVSVILQLPESCTVNLVNIPLGIEPHSSLSEYYDSVTRKFDFADAIENNADEAGVILSNESTPLTIDEDPIANYNFAFLLDENLLAETDITLTPTVDCPDDETLTLQTFTVDVDVTDLFSLTHDDDLSGSAAQGSSIDVTTSITNNSTIDRTELTLTLTATGGPTVNFRDTTNCTITSATEAECTFDLASGVTQTFITDFDIPDNVTTTTTFQLDATLTVSEDGDTITEEASQAYTVQGSGTS